MRHRDGDRRMGERGALFVALIVASGCSALIDPDLDRLGGPMDAGGGVDAARADGAVTTDGGVVPGDDGGARDGGGECPASCADEHPCTVDSCVDGLCVHTPSDGACGDEERCSVTLGCVPLRCTADPECADGIYCNGVERCDPTGEGSGCVGGAPVVCDDGAPCTTDACDEGADRCASTPDHAVCDDEVGCTVDRCAPGPGVDAMGCTHAPDPSVCVTGFCTVGGSCDVAVGCVGGTTRDCSDATPCTDDSCDEGAGACQNTLRDGDGDGFGPVRIVVGGGTFECGGLDCDDLNPDKYPGAPEHCDTIDNDCNGVIDDGCAPRPDTCASAEPIVLGDARTGMATGRFAGLTNDYVTNPRCGAPLDGRDAVYYVDVPSGTWDIRVDTEGSSANTVLGVGIECSVSGLAAACNDDRHRGVTEASRIWLHRVTGGSGARVYILVDAYDSSETEGYTVRVALTAAAPDRCSSFDGSRPLDISGGGTVVGIQAELVGGVEGSCQPGIDLSGEAAFRITATSTVLDLEAYSAEFIPDIHLREDDCRNDSEIECVEGSTLGAGVNLALMRRTVRVGDFFYFFVDGGRGTYALYYEPF